jgi:hypothetical protein
MTSKFYLQPGFAIALLIVVASSTGCSIKKIAISKLGDSLASQSTSSFASGSPEESSARKVICHKHALTSHLPVIGQV